MAGWKRRRPRTIQQSRRRRRAERLLPASPEVVPLVQFLEGLYVEGLDLTRERDLGREAAL